MTENEIVDMEKSLETENVQYYHLRIGHGVTLAYVITSNNWVQFSYAICSKNDQYCKAIGRDIAEERLIHPKQKKVHGFRVQEGAKRFEILREILTIFLVDVYKGTPYIKSSSWLRKMLPGTPVCSIVNKLFPREEKATKVIRISF